MTDAMTQLPELCTNDVSAIAPPIEDLIPHRGTMRLLDAVDTYDASSLVARATVRRDAWYADAQGRMPAWIGLELMAQAIAAHVGLLSRQAGEPMRPGVLLGSRRYEAHVDAFASAADLRIRVTELLRSEAGHGAYECEIVEHDIVRAQAIVKVYQPDDFESFIQESFKS